MKPTGRSRIVQVMISPFQGRRGGQPRLPPPSVPDSLLVSCPLLSQVRLPWGRGLCRKKVHLRECLLQTCRLLQSC